MNVMFDHQIFSVQRYGGYTKYYVSLSRALRQLPDFHAQIVAPAHVNEYLEPQDSRHPLTFALRHPRRGLKYRPALAAPLFRLAAGWRRPDIVHETHYILKGGQLPRGVPVMATCHDMIVERTADGSSASRDAIRHKRLSFERASGIICISENTRADLLERYPQFESRVSVVHHGVDAIEPRQPSGLRLPSSYLLFVGVRGGYKNFANAVRAIGASSRAGRNLDLVCFGGGALNAAERRICADAGLDEGRVLQISGDDQLLAHAYRQALALIYPSSYEGFGMPLTEAMVQGCPVLCSNSSCFPEICADAALYFDPDDVDSIRQAIERLLDQPQRRASLVRDGRRRASAFTWASCAAGTAAAYARAVSAGPVP